MLAVIPVQRQISLQLNVLEYFLGAKVDSSWKVKM